MGVPLSLTEISAKMELASISAIDPGGSYSTSQASLPLDILGGEVAR
jgi:hypothetical protein